MPPETRVGLRLLPTNPVLFTTRLLISRFRVGFGLLGAMGKWVLVGGRKMHDVILKLFLLITRRQKEILFKTKITKISSSIGTALVCYECDRFLSRFLSDWLPPGCIGLPVDAFNVTTSAFPRPETCCPHVQVETFQGCRRSRFQSRCQFILAAVYVDLQMLMWGDVYSSIHSQFQYRGIILPLLVYSSAPNLKVLKNIYSASWQYICLRFPETQLQMSCPALEVTYHLVMSLPVSLT